MTLPPGFQFPSDAAFLKNPTRYLQDLYFFLAQEVNRPGWRLEGTIAVPAGNATITVPVSVDRLPYFVVVTPDWLTTFRVAAGRTIAQFVVDFGTVAPGGGGNIDWFIRQPEAGP